MKFLRLISSAIALALLSAFFNLPVDVAKDLYVHPIAEEIREGTGFKMEHLETFLSYGAFVLPLLAALSTLYLYHKVYMASEVRKIKAKYQSIRDLDEKTKIDFKVIAATIVLILFIPF